MSEWVDDGVIDDVVVKDCEDECIAVAVGVVDSESEVLLDIGIDADTERDLDSDPSSVSVWPLHDRELVGDAELVSVRDVVSDASDSVRISEVVKDVEDDNVAEATVLV